MLSSRYLLLHGAWHASWCWEKIVPKLTALGHGVLAPDLPGHGNHKMNVHDIELSTYVDFVLELIEAEKTPVTLVGHSMAGIVLSQVAELVPQKIHELIYISALIPRNGMSLLQTTQRFTVTDVADGLEIDEESNLMTLNKNDRAKGLLFNLTSQEDASCAFSRLEPEPFKPFLAPLSVTPENFGSIKKRYISCLADQAIVLQDQKRMYRGVVDDVIFIDADHSPFYSRPNELVDILCN